MNKTIKLPVRLTLALANYYISRGRARSHDIGSTWKDGITTIEYSKTGKWDKDACMAEVDKALPAGWGCTASCGTFWFCHKGSKNTYRISESTWPLAEVIEPHKA